VRVEPGTAAGSTAHGEWIDLNERNREDGQAYVWEISSPTTTAVLVGSLFCVAKLPFPSIPNQGKHQRTKKRLHGKEYAINGSNGGERRAKTAKQGAREIEERKEK
jgi:hypothetical protein